MPTETKRLALGRIFRLMSRPSRPGDVEDYERARSVFLSEIEFSERKPESIAPHGWNFGRIGKGCVE